MITNAEEFGLNDLKRERENKLESRQHEVTKDDKLFQWIFAPVGVSRENNFFVEFHHDLVPHRLDKKYLKCRMRNTNHDVKDFSCFSTKLNNFI